VLVMSGAVEVDETILGPGSMLYLGSARRELEIRAEAPARVMLLGGVPFEEQIVMWWNFVARSNEEIVAARTAWEAGAARSGAGAAFADVPGFDGYRLPAPPLPAGRLKPGGAVR
jgi:quercetin 2,3-dioxygenase